MPFAVHVSPVNDAPVLAINAGLHADLGAAATIGDRALLVQDVDNTAAELTATLTAAPAHGTLELNGVALTVGGTFTQQDVNDGKLSFQANPGVDAVTDAITFNVSDGAGGTLGSGDICDRHRARCDRPGGSTAATASTDRVARCAACRCDVTGAGCDRRCSTRRRRCYDRHHYQHRPIR